jgi:hypothetical protein
MRTLGARSAPALFQQDLIALFELLRQKRIEPLVAAAISSGRGATCAAVARNGRRYGENRPHL